MILTEVFLFTGTYFFLDTAAPVLSLLLPLLPLSEAPLTGVKRSTSVPRVVMVTLLDLLLGGPSGVSWSVSFLLGLDFMGKKTLVSEVEASGNPDGSAPDVSSSAIMLRLGVEGLGAGFLPLFLTGTTSSSISFSTESSFSSSSTKVGRGAAPAIARADSTSSGLTEVCLLLLGVEGVVLGVPPVIKPPSGAESRDSEAPDSLLDLLLGVKGSPEPMSPEDILRLRLVGVKRTSSFLGVNTFLSGVRCLGRAEAFTGVVGEVMSDSKGSVPSFLAAFLVDLTGLCLGLVDMLAVSGLDLDPRGLDF